MTRIMLTTVLLAVLATTACTSASDDPEGPKAATGVRLVSGKDRDATVWARAVQGDTEESIASVRWSPSTHVASWERGALRGETRIAELDEVDAERLVAKLANAPIDATKTKTENAEGSAYITCSRFFGCEYIELWGATCNACAYIETSCESGLVLTCATTE